MTVICVDNKICNPISDKLCLSIGKKYKTEGYNSFFYIITDDNGNIVQADIRRFNTITEYRNNQLNKLGL